MDVNDLRCLYSFLSLSVTFNIFFCLKPNANKVYGEIRRNFIMC